MEYEILMSDAESYADENIDVVLDDDENDAHDIDDEVVVSTLLAK